MGTSDAGPVESGCRLLRIRPTESKCSSHFGLRYFSMEDLQTVPRDWCWRRIFKLQRLPDKRNLEMPTIVLGSDQLNNEGFCIHANGVRDRAILLFKSALDAESKRDVH